MIISAERCCWHHYFLKETEGPSIFMFRKHPILLSRFFDVARNHWTEKHRENSYSTESLFLLNKEGTRYWDRSFCFWNWTHMEKAMVRTRLCPEIVFHGRVLLQLTLKRKGSKSLFFHWSRSWDVGAGTRLQEFSVTLTQLQLCLHESDESLPDFNWNLHMKKTDSFDCL